jgi:hypothetical protein
MCEKAGILIYFKLSQRQSHERHWHLKCGLIVECALGYRIEAAGMKGMTSQQTPESQVGSLDDAVLVNRQAGILRTTRIESTGRSQNRRHDQLVAPNQYQNENLTDFMPPYQHVGGYFRKVVPAMSPSRYTRDWMNFSWQ